MQKKRFKVMMLIMITALVLLTACSSNNGSSNTSNGSGNNQSPANTDTSGGPVQNDEKITITVGQIPVAAAGYFLEYIRENKLIEKYANELGYSNVEVVFNSYPGAPPQIEHFIAGNLDFAYTGMIPNSQAIQKGAGITLIGTPEGAAEFSLSVPADSPISSIEDLKGKTIGTYVGGDIHIFLMQVLKANLGGSGNPQEYGINIVNLSSNTQMINIPRGIDAVTTFYPQYLLGKNEGKLKALATNQGNSDLTSDGKAPSFSNSPYAPEAFSFHRSMFVTRTAFLNEHPDLVTAFMMAAQHTMDQMKSGNVEPIELARLVEGPDAWNMDAETGAKVVEMGWARPFVWLTEGDIQGMESSMTTMKELGMVDNDWSAEQIKDNIRPALPAIKKAYDLMESTTYTEEDFLKTDEDIRGLPVWEMDKWGN